MKPARVSDSEMGELAHEYRRLRASSKSDLALSEVVAGKIIVEMDARKKRVEVFDGVRVRVAKSRRVVAFEKAKALVGIRKIKAFQRDPEINKKLWDAAVKAGDIDTTAAEGCLVEQPVKAHIYANLVDGDEEEKAAA